MVQLRLRSRRAAGLQCGVQERPSTLHGPNRADSTLDSAPLRGLHCFCYVCRVRCTCVCVVYCVLGYVCFCWGVLRASCSGALLTVSASSAASSTSPLLSHNRRLCCQQQQYLSRMNLTQKILQHLGLQVRCGASSVRAADQLLAF